MPTKDLTSNELFDSAIMSREPRPSADGSRPARLPLSGLGASGKITGLRA